MREGESAFVKLMYVDNNTIIYRLYRLGQPYIYSIWETQAEKEGKVTRITVMVLLRFL